MDAPSSATIFADGGMPTPASFAPSIAAPFCSPPTVDAWVEDVQADAQYGQTFGGGVGYYRTPSDPSFSSGDSVSINRQNNRCNLSFFDGHAQGMKNSQIGYQFARTNTAALWSRDYTYSSPYFD